MQGGAPTGESRVGATSLSTRAVLVRYAVGTVVATALIVVGGFLVLRSVALDEARLDTKAKVIESGQLIESVVTDGLLTGEAEALRAVDDAVLGRVLSNSVVRAKIWSPDGTVLYSDDPSQIGARFTLSEAQVRLLREGGAEVEVGDLEGAENEGERGQGRLIEAYTGIRTPSGEPVLFEIYEQFDSVNASARRLLGELAPTILGAVALLVLIQIPLVWSLIRGLERASAEREALLAHAIGSSNRERRRVAAYLHDGPVQDIAGVAFSLAPVADSARGRGELDEASVLVAAIDNLRHSVRDLRALLIDLHPAHLQAAGLEAGLRDLLSPLDARGIETMLSVVGTEHIEQAQEALVYRTAQEALRNVVDHAAATSVSVRVVGEPGVTNLTVSDDGQGFTAEQRSRRASDGHLGLSLLGEVARQSGADLRIASTPGEGTTIALEVPAR